MVLNKLVTSEQGICDDTVKEHVSKALSKVNAV